MAVKVNCLNPIAACGMKLLPDTYEITDNYADADAVLVRSASMMIWNFQTNSCVLQEQVQV